MDERVLNHFHTNKCLVNMGANKCLVNVGAKQICMWCVEVYKCDIVPLYIYAVCVGKKKGAL